MLRCFLGLFNAFGISMSLVDKSVFKSTLNLCALRIHAKDTSKTLTLLRDEALFSRPRMKRVVEVPEGDVGQRLVLLSERITTVEDLPRYEELQTEVQVLGITTYALHLGYEHMSVEEVLRRLLPVGVEVPSSFEQIGHIAHLNLRDEMLPYKSVIGQVIIDKTPTIKTVINKIGNIQNEFRTFPMEVLAGDPNFKVVIRESGAKFTFDFSRVYWNSRLQMEHSRLIDFISQDISNKRPVVVADMMAGVGPFAVPLALRLKLANASRPHSAVYANDLNPASYEYLVENTRLNNCSSHMNSFNLDGRDFIRQLDSQGVAYTDVIMNLPQNAIDFVDVFIGMLSRSPPQSPARSPPVVHVYAFSSSIDPVEDVRNRIASVLRCSSSQLLPTQIWNKRSSRAYLEANSLAHIVRDVAPNKVMVCYSFRLPRDVAEGVIEEVDGATKRRRLDDSADLGVP